MVLCLKFSIRREKHVFAEKFIRSLVEKYGKHSLYTDSRTWYDEACNILKLKHYLHSSIEKSLMERVNISRTGSRILMSVIHVSEMNVIYFMYITGYNSLFQCTMIPLPTRMINYSVTKRGGKFNLN
jgi:hypothetical protein